MKLLQDEIQNNWRTLQERLGYSFSNEGLLEKAMTHSSYANESQDSDLPDNERLEFLGDAVLDLVISQHLMLTHPEAHEGDLTRIRAEVVASPSLSSLARELKLGDCLLLGKGEEHSGGRSKSNLLADALEAVIGAIFLDSSFDEVNRVVLPLFMPALQQASSEDGQDYKSRLQEQVQAMQGELPVYRLFDAIGPPHERTYYVEVYIQGQLKGDGQGRSKKIAEQAAAKAALSSLGQGQ
jgi:ribonuclease-3